MTLGVQVIPHVALLIPHSRSIAHKDIPLCLAF